MTYTFNLITERWIPCIRGDGMREELGLREALAQAHTLREIRGDTPLETAALHRLVLAVLHRVFGPRNGTEWRKLWHRRAQGFDMAALDGYLQKWQHKFDLFDEAQPFMQSRDPRVNPKSVISMVIQMASGANGTLFDHHLESQEVRLSPAQAARALLVAQAFGIGGLSGLPDKFTDAPAAKGILFFALGDTLSETLTLNMMAYSGDAPIANEDDDCPGWERNDPHLPARSVPRGYLDYLTWQNRKVWLFPTQVSESGETAVTQMCWAPGLRLDATDIDPHKQYIRPDEKEDWRILSFRADRALWRDSSLLLRLSDRQRPPKVVMWLQNLARENKLDMARAYRLMALGMAKDRASLEFLRAENLPLLPAYLAEVSHFENLSGALGLADRIAGAVRSSVKTFGRWYLKPNLPDEKLTKDDRESIQGWADASGADERYWSQLEPHFNALIEQLPINADDANDAWRKQLKRASDAAFTSAERCAGADLRAQRARALARDQFDGLLKRVLSQDNQPLASAQGETT
jgi:CRISPR system Cascade subunit CasA